MSNDGVRIVIDRRGGHYFWTLTEHGEEHKGQRGYATIAEAADDAVVFRSQRIWRVTSKSRDWPTARHREMPLCNECKRGMVHLRSLFHTFENLNLLTWAQPNSHQTLRIFDLQWILRVRQKIIRPRCCQQSAKVLIGLGRP
jgi:hypothetical protein